MCYEILENLKQDNVKTDLTEKDQKIITKNINTIIDNIKEDFRSDSKIQENVMKVLENIKEY
jgi:cation transport regulator ChaB